MSGVTRYDNKGISPKDAKIPPATKTPAIRGPIIYPTPKYSGVISPATTAEGKNLLNCSVPQRGTSDII